VISPYPQSVISTHFPGGLRGARGAAVETTVSFCLFLFGDRFRIMAALV